MINVKDVEHIASLARLELTSEEKEKLQKDLEAILRFVDKLKELNVEGVLPTTAEKGTVNIMRADEPKRIETDTPVLHNMLAQAPDQKDGFVKVKNILKK